MRGEKIVRMLALVALCALVYYFSFEQGRMAQIPKINRLQDTVDARERVIESMAAEIRKLKDEAADLEKKGESSSEPAGQTADETAGRRLTVRLQASRLMFNDKLVLTCLDIEKSGLKTRLQINIVPEDKLVTETVGLGQSLKFTMEGRNYTLIVDQVHSSFISVVITP